MTFRISVLKCYLPAASNRPTYKLQAVMSSFMHELSILADCYIFDKYTLLMESEESLSVDSGYACL